MYDSAHAAPLHVRRLSDLAVLPRRATDGAVGYDLCSAEAVKIAPMSRFPVPTHLEIAVPDGCYGRIAPRSGLSAKKCIDMAAGVVDPDYRGQIYVLLVNNHPTESFDVEVGARIGQLIIERAETPLVVEVNSLSPTKRGDGGFGSTDRCALEPKRVPPTYDIRRYFSPVEKK